MTLLLAAIFWWSSDATRAAYYPLSEPVAWWETDPQPGWLARFDGSPRLVCAWLASSTPGDWGPHEARALRLIFHPAESRGGLPALFDTPDRQAEVVFDFPLRAGLDSAGRKLGQSVGVLPTLDVDPFERKTWVLTGIDRLRYQVRGLKDVSTWGISIGDLDDLRKAHRMWVQEGRRNRWFHQ